MRFAEIFKTELFSKYGQKAGCYINEIYDIVITDKETVEDYNGSESGATNYFFHYGHDTNKRMQVNQKVYSQYNVGDMFPAYTKDHYYYGSTINSVLPKTEYKNNELSKAGIVTIGCLIL